MDVGLNDSSGYSIRFEYCRVLSSSCEREMLQAISTSLGRKQGNHLYCLGILKRNETKHVICFVVAFPPPPLAHCSVFSRRDMGADPNNGEKEA